MVGPAVGAIALTACLAAGVLAAACVPAERDERLLLVVNQSRAPVDVRWFGVTGGASEVDACAEQAIALRPGAYVVELRTAAGLARLPITVRPTGPAPTVGIVEDGTPILGWPERSAICRNA